jgi:hypothetical protein
VDLLQVDHLSETPKKLLFQAIWDTVSDKVIPEESEESEESEEEGGGGGESKTSKNKGPKDMPMAIEKFKEWFDECIEMGEANGRHWIRKGAALQHYKSWCDAKIHDSRSRNTAGTSKGRLPKAHRLSDRCNPICKGKKCPVDTCPRFLVHMCDAVGHEHYVKKDGLLVREAFEAGQGNEAKFCYKAYFKDGSAKSETIFRGRTITVVQTAEYKK